MQRSRDDHPLRRPIEGVAYWAQAIFWVLAAGLAADRCTYSCDSQGVERKLLVRR